MLDVFLTVILPTFLVAATGTALQRWRKLTIGSLGPITLYLLSPALMVDSLLHATLGAGEAGRVVAVSVVTSFAILFGSGALSALVRHPRDLQSGFLLATSFPNAGNMGLPVAFLAFGEPGLAVAAVLFSVQSVMGWTLGTYVAARSESTGLGPLKQALKIPTVYAVGIALVLRAIGWELPFALDTSIGLLAQAAIPAMLLVLGFQLAQGVELTRWRSLTAAMVIRLIAGAAVAYGISSALGLTGAAQQTVIVVAAMPTAVFTTLLATEFRAEPRFVTSAVIASTVASLGTLTVLVTLLQRWLS